MPSPTTTHLPPPKSWDEFEDICADVLKCIWEDPYVVRNGRSGQRQQGVDCFGMPKHLRGPSGKKYAGAQCKQTDALTLDVLQQEVEKAREFTPSLTEYLIMTTAVRNARLQESVRIQDWPFDRVHIMYWCDISLELSGHDNLLQKHFPGWMKRTTTEEQVLNKIHTSQPEDYGYDADTSVLLHRSDTALRIVLELGEESLGEFHEPWVAGFPDPHGTRQPVYIYYGETRILKVPCVCVDGGRCVIPFPRSAIDLTITPFHYHVGRILNYHVSKWDFDFALKTASITVRE